MSALKAGLVYFLSVFAVGFMLGTIRVLLIEPHLGALGAVLLETPFILAASWLFCRCWIGRFNVPSALVSRLGMGAIAFALLIAAEILLGLYGFGRSLADQIAAWRSPPGALGLAGQILFGLFPLVQGLTEKIR
ncbi:hypothetical protein [Hyphococcus luteus]|nr:hypothetical protein [Marinicaulis flavus]